MNQATIPTIVLKTWILYKKNEESEWEPISAFASKQNADAWSNRNHDALPHMDMAAWNTKIYATCAPHTIKLESGAFSIEVEGKKIQVIDMCESPEMFSCMMAASAFVREYRSAVSAVHKTEDPRKAYSQLQALLRPIFEEDFLMAPKKPFM
jgi:hypothetical protein